MGSLNVREGEHPGMGTNDSIRFVCFRRPMAQLMVMRLWHKQIG